MGIIKKSILTEQQEAEIKSLIDNGYYENDGEYIKDIVEKDLNNRKKVNELQKALRDGIESGSCDATIDSIWDEVLKENERIS